MMTELIDHQSDKISFGKIYNCVISIEILQSSLKYYNNNSLEFKISKNNDLFNNNVMDLTT